jgi:hypothetical protein
MGNSSKALNKYTYYFTIKCKECDHPIRLTLNVNADVHEWFRIHKQHKRYCRHCKRNVNILLAGD